MARAPQRSAGGPGSAGTIVFLVLSVILAGVCVFLTMGYLKRGASLTTLQGEIKKDLEDPLSRSLHVSALPVASESDVAYDDSFFLKVQKSALQGLDYDKLLAKVGYTGEPEISDELQKMKMQPSPETLHASITALTEQFGTAQRQLDERNQALQLATEQAKTAQDLQKQESANLDSAIRKSAKDLEDAQNAYDKDKAEIKQLMAKAEDDAKRAWAETHAQAELHKKEAADLQAKYDKLQQKYDDAMKELQRKRPQTVAVAEGKILQSDPIEGVAIINLGKKEQIQNGEKFTVFRIGRAGERVPKGELVVVRVDDLVSTADILKSNPDDPVMRDDVVEREKKTEEPEQAGK